jgi:hypothetical protein
MKPRESWGCVPALQTDTGEHTKNEDKAQAFLNLFFPVINTPDPGNPTTSQLELPWQPITELEI